MVGKKQSKPHLARGKFQPGLAVVRRWVAVRRDIDLDSGLIFDTPIKLFPDDQAGNAAAERWVKEQQATMQPEQIDAAEDADVA